MTEAMRAAAILVVAGLLEGIRQQAYRGPWPLMAAIIPAGRLVRARPLGTAPDSPAALRAAMEYGALLAGLSPIAFALITSGAVLSPPGGVALVAAVHFHPETGARPLGLVLLEAQQDTPSLLLAEDVAAMGARLAAAFFEGSDRQRRLRYTPRLFVN